MAGPRCQSRRGVLLAASGAVSPPHRRRSVPSSPPVRMATGQSLLRVRSSGAGASGVRLPAAGGSVGWTGDAGGVSPPPRRAAFGPVPVGRGTSIHAMLDSWSRRWVGSHGVHSPVVAGRVRPAGVRCPSLAITAYIRASPVPRGGRIPITSRWAGVGFGSVDRLVGRPIISISTRIAVLVVAPTAAGFARLVVRESPADRVAPSAMRGIYGTGRDMSSVFVVIRDTSWGIGRVSAGRAVGYGLTECFENPGDSGG